MALNNSSCAGGCMKFGSHDDDGGQVSTRCLYTDFPPFLDRAQIANTTRPTVNLGKQTDLESSFRPCMSRIEGGCRTLRIPDALNFDYLPFGWQQPDTRPWTFRVHTRQNVKDYCRMSPEDYMGEESCNNLKWKCIMSTIYPRDDDCLCPAPHQTNDVHKYVNV